MRHEGKFNWMLVEGEKNQGRHRNVNWRYRRRERSLLPSEFEKDLSFLSKRNLWPSGWALHETTHGPRISPKWTIFDVRLSLFRSAGLVRPIQLSGRRLVMVSGLYKSVTATTTGKWNASERNVTNVWSRNPRDEEFVGGILSIIGWKRNKMVMDGRGREGQSPSDRWTVNKWMDCQCGQSNVVRSK